MFDRLRVGRRALAAIVATLLAPAALPAPPAVDRDTREISAFVLTETAFTKYVQATKKLQAGRYRSAAPCDDSDDGESIDAQVAHVDAIPGATAAVRSAGLSTREYVVIGWSLFQAGMAAWAVSQPGAKLPAGVTMANVNFYRAHEATIKTLGLTSRSDDCEDDRDDDS